MTDIEDIGASFHHACMTGAGWEACRLHFTPDATFEHEGETFAGLRTLEAYAACWSCTSRASGCVTSRRSGTTTR